MYLRIEIAPEDRPFHRFLWRDLDQRKALEEYEFGRVVFGMNSSPFLAQFVTQRHAETHRTQYLLAAEAALKSTYKDDSMDSVADDQQGIELHKQLSQVWKRAGMQARKWLYASEDAYGYVVYYRNVYPSGLKSSVIVAAKTSVAALRAISVPCLELMGAVLGLRLTKEISKALNISDSVFWSDSVDVLWWLRNAIRSFKPFLANRVAEIQSLCSSNQWRYISTENNPADLATRGVTASGLACSEIWWQGPKFLKKPEWPENLIQASSSSQKEFRSRGRFSKVQTNKGQESTLTAATINESRDWRLNPQRFSSWTRLARVHAWVSRFLDNCCLSKEQRITGELTIDEIRNAENEIIAQAQQQAFPDEHPMLAQAKNLPHSSKLLQLRPVLDEDELVRCDGRLRYAECLPYDPLFPIILPGGHWVTTLIVKHYHEKGYHASGTNQTLTFLDHCSERGNKSLGEELYGMQKTKSKACQPNDGAFATDNTKLYYSCLAPFDTTLGTNSSLHIISAFDVMPFIDVTPHMAFN
ncbi:PREDICTED: uncharacterized protein LOC107347901 [Acropora digitifera]|uniref:uncharacterized protein LOC107347901 n=1 Tax=Acropora digitifera TaxID=70779 RepID=UPI00077B248F|nr:PREDICTED: uncharacterized protein LOC107347901 [Acropora digitifera]